MQRHAIKEHNNISHDKHLLLMMKQQLKQTKKNEELEMELISSKKEIKELKENVKIQEENIENLHLKIEEQNETIEKLEEKMSGRQQNKLIRSIQEQLDWRFLLSKLQV